MLVSYSYYHYYHNHLSFININAINYHYEGPEIPISKFLKPAVTCALASPLSYFAISNNLISYPLMVLTKSSKPVPVMIIGLLFFKRRYDWFKYVSVLLVCIGISYYTYSEQNGDGNLLHILIFRYCLFL